MTSRGIQLHTLRSLLAKDVPGTLRLLAESFADHWEVLRDACREARTVTLWPRATSRRARSCR